MAGLVNQSEIGSDKSSNLVLLVRACRDPRSDGGTGITDEEAQVIEYGALDVAAQNEELRVIDAMCQQLRRRGALAGFDPRVTRDVKALKDHREELAALAGQYEGLFQLTLEEASEAA